MNKREVEEKLSRAELRIAYLEGVMDGSGIMTGMNNPPKDDVEIQHDEDDICDDCDIPSEELVAFEDLPPAVRKAMKESMESDCECPACQSFDKKLIDKFGENKLDQLNYSSEEIQKWADENDVKVDRGDPSDN